MKVNNKRAMYEMLQAGAFGNTTPMWFNLAEWQRGARSYGRDALWGIRTADTSGHDKRTKLDVPTLDVAPLFRQWFPNGGGQLSPMVDHMTTARMHIHEGPELTVWVVEGWTHVKWRDAFKLFGCHVEGTRARAVLEQYLNPNSLDDLKELLGTYPGHVVELTTLDRCYGTEPHRNTVIWEVRNY